MLLLEPPSWQNIYKNTRVLCVSPTNKADQMDVSPSPRMSSFELDQHMKMAELSPKMQSPANSRGIDSLIRDIYYE